MFDAEAFAREPLRLYLPLSAGLAAAAAASIAWLRRAAGRDVTHAAEALRGWLVMIPLVAACVYLGPAAAVALFAAAGVAAVVELARAARIADRALTAVACAGVAALGVAALAPGTPYGAFTAAAAATAAALAVIPVLRDRPEGALRGVATALFAFVVAGWLFGHVFLLAGSRATLPYLLFLVFAVEVSDVAAYAFGKAFGRRPLRPRVSPNKTWEGALGALAVSLALPWVLRPALPGLSPAQLLLAGLAVGVCGQLGDLVASAAKRDLGVKDMGTLIRGHGGVFDRIDSLALAAPAFVLVVRAGGAG